MRLHLEVEMSDGEDEMAAKLLISALSFWVLAAVEAAAHGHGHGWGHGVPEIDGVAGIAAMATLVTIGLIAYNRFKK